MTASRAPSFTAKQVDIHKPLCKSACSRGTAATGAWSTYNTSSGSDGSDALVARPCSARRSSAWRELLATAGERTGMLLDFGFQLL